MWKDKRLKFLYLKDSEDMNNIADGQIWVRTSNKIYIDCILHVRF